MSSEFTRKQKFKLKKIRKLIYKEHRERTEVNVIDKQKWSVILEILWLVCHNSEIDWRTGEVKMLRRSEEYKRQQKPKQRKLE